MDPVKTAEITPRSSNSSRYWCLRRKFLITFLAVKCYGLSVDLVVFSCKRQYNMERQNAVENITLRKLC